MRVASRVSLERIAAFDRAVRAGRYPNAATIARALEVSRRTVQRDIEFLRDRLGAPLEFDDRRNGYRYRDPTYHIGLLTLSEGELVALFLAERVLGQYRGTPYARELARAFRKLTLGLTDRVTIDLGHLGESYSFRTTAAADLDPGLFRDLAAAVAGSRRVVLDYWSASRDERLRRAVDPYHLAAVDGQWYLIGHCHLRGDVRMFAPARIRALEVTDETFDRPRASTSTPTSRTPSPCCGAGRTRCIGSGSGSRAIRPATCASGPGTRASRSSPTAPRP
jgi:proteasome accessory factor B